jgi:hypothetical protein
MAAIKEVATQFFEACEAGKGWEACKAYCKPDATFSAQAEPLADVRTLQAYADWMQGLMKMLPDGCYDLKSFATDDQPTSPPMRCSPGRTPARADRRRPASARVPTTSTPWTSPATKSAT